MAMRRDSTPSLTLTQTESATAHLQGDVVEAATDTIPLTQVPVEHYAFGAEHGRGGIGVVLRARDRRLGRVVAVKLLQQQDAAAMVRFEREMRITARLQHPGVVPIHEAGRLPGGEPFYVMKLVEGRSLKSLMAATATLEQRLALLPHLLAVAETLAYAHARQVIHRDVKPSNVIVGDYGETVLLDWGLAKQLGDATPDPYAGDVQPADEAGLTRAGAVVGTPLYMAPEQARGEAVDARADVYAVGAILYHLLAGETPYPGASSAEVLDALVSGPPAPLVTRVAGLPAELGAIVDKAMARDRNARYADAAALGEDLRKLQAGQLVGAFRYSQMDLLMRWLRKHAAMLSVAALAMLCLVLVGAFSLATIVASRRRAERALADSIEARRALEEHLRPQERFELVDAQPNPELEADMTSKLRDALGDAVPRSGTYHMACRGDVCRIVIEETYLQSDQLHMRVLAALQDSCYESGGESYNTDERDSMTGSAVTRSILYIRRCEPYEDRRRFCLELLEQFMKGPDMKACRLLPPGTGFLWFAFHAQPKGKLQLVLGGDNRATPMGRCVEERLGRIVSATTSPFRAPLWAAFSRTLQ